MRRRGETTELDLANLAKDVDQQDQGKLKFDFDGQQPGGLDARIDGNILKVTPGGSLNPGARGTLPLKVTDGRSDAVRAAITVTVVSSNRPKPVANDDTVEKADAGKPQTVNVLGNDFNPFTEPLKIVSAVVETGSAGQPEVSGDSITVTPAAGFKGVLVVRYTIKDKTDDPGRQAVGRVRITVRDKPDAPSAPSATDVRSRTAVLKWAPPSDNGAPITKYTVRSAGFQQECPTTTCTLTGLTNNVKYVFAVTATNEVGDSPASVASNEIRPDEKPSPPEPPAVKAGDKDLAITWTPAKTEGSPVKHYNLEISPPPANGIAVKNDVTGLSYTWAGLTNGVKYKVRAQAVNDLGPSDWGLYSAEDNPAGPPGAPAAPTTAVVSSVGSQNQLRASWSEPDINGDPIKNYYVTMSGGDGATQTQTVPGNVRTATFTANNSESGYTFTVQAENKAGKGAVSAASAPRRATGKLGTVGNVSATPANTGGSRRPADHQLHHAQPGPAQRVELQRGQLYLPCQHRPIRTHPAGPDGRWVRQRPSEQHHGDCTVLRGAKFGCQPGSHRNTLRFTGDTLGVGNKRCHERPLRHAELGLAVDVHQRRQDDEDPDQRGSVGDRGRLRQPDDQHRWL
ncbi:fibronectin type III domain-containing protein [Paenarthrobacter sp. S56]|uniref:fibronectin type III domain-containing protein n=1 Tax=Paenarthrobacter sp. S56 TaxID=3138179 RepID=UPI0032195546